MRVYVYRVIRVYLMGGCGHECVEGGCLSFRTMPSTYLGTELAGGTSSSGLFGRSFRVHP